jgi:DNA-binding IclR family transcriptional regulator
MSSRKVIPIGPVARTHEHRTVSRVMAILELVAANEPIGLRLAELCDMIGAPKSSVHGLVRGLVTTGYLRETQGRYGRGPATAMLTIDGEQIPAAFHVALQELTAAWNETAFLATLAGDSVINIDLVEPHQIIRASPPIHERRPMWPSSSGKVFLAFMDARRRDNYLNRVHPDPKERASIVAELEIVRATGVGCSRGEVNPELYGISSPIMVADAGVAFTVGLAGPSTRMRPIVDAVAAAVLVTAQRLSSHNAFRATDFTFGSIPSFREAEPLTARRPTHAIASGTHLDS